MSVWMTCPTCSSRLICLESSGMRAAVPGSIRPALLAAGHRCGCATGGAQMPTGTTVHASPHSTSARRHHPPSRVMCSSPSVQEVPVPGAAQLRPPPLRREIDVVEPEAVGVALGPLEVIEQSPGEISPDRDGARGRLTQRRHVTDGGVAGWALAAVDRGSPFDLVGGSGAPPAEPGWELVPHEARGRICGRDRHEPSVGCLPLRFAYGRSRRAYVTYSFGRYVSAVMEKPRACVRVRRAHRRASLRSVSWRQGPGAWRS